MEIGEVGRFLMTGKRKNVFVRGGNLIYSFFFKDIELIILNLLRFKIF